VKGKIILPVAMVETLETEATKFGIRATVRQLGVYLDNFSIIEIARGDAARRDRLVHAFERGADLMFSAANAAEIIGPERPSTISAVRNFLDAVGPNWFPVEGLDIVGVLEREASGADRSTACLSTWFLQQFFASRSIHLHGEQRQGLVGPEYFQLGFVLDWLSSHRADIRRRVDAFEASLGAKLTQLRRAYERNLHAFDENLPDPEWDAARPATFAWNGLLRRLIVEAKAFRYKKGDAVDLCHAVVGVAYANFATLDKQWKRRVASLPQPNNLARVYYEPELDRLVEDVESAIVGSSGVSQTQ
jgi:hypothetical protein